MTTHKQRPKTQSPIVRDNAGRLLSENNDRGFSPESQDEPIKTNDCDWQLQHYARVGKGYGSKHFTNADCEFTSWILSQIASEKSNASRIAEVGAGTCVFASLLGKKLQSEQKVVCYEPVAELLEGAAEFDNVEPVCGGGLEFAKQMEHQNFDLIFTKDTAHHFPPYDLSAIHQGFCDNLNVGGMYLMVVRTPPKNDAVPVGEIASEKWASLYTSLDSLLNAMRSITGWREVEVTQWEQAVSTPIDEWINGVKDRDTWSVFSALTDKEISSTVEELTTRFAGQQTFDFLHQYDVAVFETQ